MKIFVDGSVLVPAFLDDHVHHEPSMDLLRKSEKRNSFCAAHTLAEVYSILTRMPGSHRASTEEAMLFLSSLSDRFTSIVLDTAEYWTTIATCSESGIGGGRVYDALIARCAIKASAEVIYTWNVGHFLQLGEHIARRVRTP